MTIVSDDGTLIKGSGMKYQLMLRTYLWGKCSFDDSDPTVSPTDFYQRSDVISRLKDSQKDIALSEIDVWHSHMVRVQVGHLGMIPAAFIDTITRPKCSTTDEARELQKLVTRMKHNVVLDAYDYESATALVGEQLPTARVKASAKSKAKADKKTETETTVKAKMELGTTDYARTPGTDES